MKPSTSLALTLVLACLLAYLWLTGALWLIEQLIGGVR